MISFLFISYKNRIYNWVLWAGLTIGIELDSDVPVFYVPGRKNINEKSRSDGSCGKKKPEYKRLFSKHTIDYIFDHFGPIPGLFPSDLISFQRKDSS